MACSPLWTGPWRSCSEELKSCTCLSWQCLCRTAQGARRKVGNGSSGVASAGQFGLGVSEKSSQGCWRPSLLVSRHVSKSTIPVVRVIHAAGRLYRQRMCLMSTRRDGSFAMHRILRCRPLSFTMWEYRDLLRFLAGCGWRWSVGLGLCRKDRSWGVISNTSKSVQVFDLVHHRPLFSIRVLSQLTMWWPFSDWDPCPLCWWRAESPGTLCRRWLETCCVGPVGWLSRVTWLRGGFPVNIVAIEMLCDWERPMILSMLLWLGQVLSGCWCCRSILVYLCLWRPFWCVRFFSGKTCNIDSDGSFSRHVWPAAVFQPVLGPQRRCFTQGFRLQPAACHLPRPCRQKGRAVLQSSTAAALATCLPWGFPKASVPFGPAEAETCDVFFGSTTCIFNSGDWCSVLTSLEGMR